MLMASSGFRLVIVSLKIKFGYMTDDDAVASMDSEGYLTIRGRIKDVMLVQSQTENVLC